jgi:hypothetical protein
MHGNLPPFPTHLLGLVRINGDKFTKFTKYQAQKINDATHPFAFNDYCPVLKPSIISTSEAKNTSVGLLSSMFSLVFLPCCVPIFYIVSYMYMYHVFNLLRKETLSVGVPEVISLVTVISNLMNEEDRCY